MPSSKAVMRLRQERKLWRKDHPYNFVAKPTKKDDGSSNLMRWTCKIPGLKNTPWASGIYGVTIGFCDNYPDTTPNVSFSPPIFHPNVYRSGSVCLSILKSSNWTSTMGVKHILLALQTLLNDPNAEDPANSEAAKLYTNDRGAYEHKIRAYAKSTV